MTKHFDATLDNMSKINGFYDKQKQAYKQIADRLIAANSKAQTQSKKLEKENVLQEASSFSSSIKCTRHNGVEDLQIITRELI